ncbi:GIP [Symbiodinium sp. CCMP2592]|nr:GIP [Symbiodinium sp. CCMP2592]
MGAIIEQLGYKLVWSAGSCKLYPPDGKSLRLRVKNGCPELVESQALTLISRLEEHKMQQVEELRRRTDEGKDRIRQAKIAMQRTWWDHLVEHVSSSAPAAGHMAVSTAPFFQDVPDRALSGLLPSEDVDSKTLWKALEEGMPNLNRRRRKALHRASNWVVHLFAGPGSHKAFKRLESQDTVVVELDICRSRSQDLYHDPLWTLLAKVAKLGRVAAVIGGPPTRTWSMSGHRADGPHPLRSPTEPFGLSTLTSDELWAPGFVQAIVYALQRWPCYRIMKFTQADWEQHVANNHVPYRRDCAVCVHGAGNGRRHHGVVHPDVYCMSADIAGPIRVKGKDPESRNHRPATFKYFLAVSYRFPRLKGVKEESDPSQTEGFDDAALLPGGTDDLADEAFPAAEGPPHEDYEDSLYEPSLAEEEEEGEGEGVEGPREFAAKVAEEHPWESARCELETPPDMARLVFAFVGDSLEEEHTPPPRRVRGKRSAGVRLDDVFALDPPPPLPPPAEAPHPEGPVSPVEEESARVARLSLQDLEGLATELIEDDWDLDEALWVLAEVCRAAPQLQHKAGLYRHGGVVGVLGGTTDKPWLTELMNMVLSAVAPTAEYTSLWLSNSTVQPVHADHHNLQGSTNVVLPLKLPPNGGDLWIELKPGDLVSGPVEERVDGKGRRWLGTTHKLERGKPFFLDPTRRHATTPWKGERAVLVGYTVNTLGKELEHEFQSLEALGFPLPASVRLPLTEQQDVRRLDAFDCFEEEPLQETKARHPDGKTSELAPGTVLKGGGWKETQAVEAGTVELEVSWNLKHSPDQRRTQSEHALLACQPDTETQVEEEEEGLSEDSLPEQPVLWELWVPHPQTGEQLCVLRSDDSDASEACALCKSEPVYTTNVELLLDGLQEPLQVVHTVDPRDAEQCIEKWMPSIHKEIGVIEKAVRRLPPAEVRSGGWLKRKEVKVVPSKFVFTVKPPDPAEASLATRKGQAYHKRKARLVACGNHAPGTGSEVYASGAAAETLLVGGDNQCESQIAVGKNQLRSLNATGRMAPRNAHTTLAFARRLLRKPGLKPIFQALRLHRTERAGLLGCDPSHYCEAYSETQAVGTGTVAQQDLQLSAFAVLLAFFQVVGAASQTTDEEEDLSLPVSLDADLMLAVSIICIGICFIAVWEFFKWCLQGVISRREAGTPVLSLSPRKARKLQRLRDQTAQAIQAEISAREEAASSQSVTFVTYQIVLSSLADRLVADNEVPAMPKAMDIAVRRCVDVLVGIVVATVVSIFLAPDRGIDELRDRENEALKCAVSALRRAGAVLAATAAGQTRDATEDEEAWTELRNEVWTSFEALNFAGDGQPGVGDVLEDARWEGRWGVDGGFLVLGGLLWLPGRCFRCCGRRKKPSSRKCLQAVLEISRLLRIVNMLVAILHEGLGEDAELPLSNDRRVLQALGPNGEGLAESLDAALAAASAMLTGQNGGKVEPVMADLEERNRLLLLGAGASRKKAGGLARNQNLGGLRAAAAIKLLDISIRALGESLRSLAFQRL